MAEKTALRNNALPYPVYGAPHTVVFPLLDADGDPVTGATCDSEISKNADDSIDCTNEGVEITATTATNGGMYYLTLTAAEMTADVVSITIHSATSKATPIVLYPRKLVTLASGTTQTSSASVAYIKLASGVVTFDNQYNGCLCVATIDSNVESRILQACTTADDQCTVTPNWNVSPDADDTYVIYLPEGRQVAQADVRALQTRSTAVDKLVSILLNTGHTDDVDISVRAMNITNDVGAALYLNGSTKDVQLGGSGTIETTAGKLVPTSLSAILGTLLTETTPGWLAAAWKKLFNVATPTLVASDVMRGTNIGDLNDFDGTGATLAAAYDAAKTAAQAGDAMTLAADAIAAENLKTGALTADAFAADALVAATFAASSLDGKGDWNTAVPDVAGTLLTLVGVYGVNLTNLGGMSTAMKAQVNAEADTALSDYGANTVTPNTIVPPTLTQMTSAFTEIKGATWASGTDTLEAIRNTLYADTQQLLQIGGAERVNYYLAADGDDANDGLTEEAPFLTLAYAVAAADVYDAINIGAGTWGQHAINNDGVAVDKGDETTVGLPITGHTFVADETILIEGTTNYDGVETVVSVTANEIVITASYAAETFGAAALVTTRSQVTLKEGQKLSGSGDAHTYIRSTRTYSSVMQINGPWNKLSELQVAGYGSVNDMGVTATGRHFEAVACIFRGSFDGLRADDLHESTITNCLMTSDYDAATGSGRGLLFDRCTCVTTGVLGSDSSPDAAFRVKASEGAAPSADSTVTLRDCLLLASRTTAESHRMVGIEADESSRVTLINTRIEATSTHADNTGDVYGLVSEDDSRINVIGGSVETSDAGSGTVADELEEDNGVITELSDKTGFSLASTGLDLVASWTTDITGTVSGNSTHDAAAVVTALGTGGTLTDCATATAVTVSNKTGFSLASTGLDLVTAWTTDITGTVSGTTTSFTEIKGATWSADTDTLQHIRDASGSSVITVTPLSSTVSAGAVSESNVLAYQHAAFGVYIWTIVDSDDDAVDLSDDTITLQVYSANDPSKQLWSTTGTVGGTSNNQVTIDDDDTNTATAGAFRYLMRNTTDDTVIAKGVLTIVAMPEVS